jgi:glycosyltransferase involved in cell wall biosynthesis
MKFSIIVVALNPGDKLTKTMQSILAQTYTDYEIVLKDGGSKDGSMEAWKHHEKVRFFDEADKSIYDAMNQAVSHAQGEYVLFLNCGDLFASETVLEQTAAAAKKLAEGERAVLYGDTLGEKNGVIIASPPKMDGFACYRNIPCHQSCFYSLSLCREKPYDLQFCIRADYDHFLWCFYRAKATMLHMGFAVSSYEGGGYSESKANQKRDKQEHKEITRIYMSGAELLRYRTIMLLTLAPLRRWMAESKAFSGFYHRVKEMLYRK